MLRIILFILALFFSQSFGLENMRCGTLLFAENLKNPQKKMLAKNGCTPENLYTDVYSKETANFIIYYTKSGPHKIKSNEYIDSLASYLEQAYSLHKNTLGMKDISGTDFTYHYRKNVPKGLYPIEIIDTGLLRDEEGKYPTTYGLTFPPKTSRPKETEIVIENDFAYGANCFGDTSRTHFKSEETKVDYYYEWKLILKATVFHELYHAFQTTYFNWLKYDTFWMEASATGVEEIGVPEANDYINYLSSKPGQSMENILEEYGEYGYATLYLFLSSEYGRKFDSYIWDYFSKFPEETFAEQLVRYVNSYGKEGEDAEDLFHKYATHIFYSRSRAASWPYPYEPFSDDMPIWPNWTINTDIPPYLPIGTFNFIRTPNDVAPNTDSVTGISLLKFGKNNDSTVWALSRLLEKGHIPRPFVPPFKEFAAFPNPWNPKRFEKVNFGPLPEKSTGVEIRSSNGALLKRIDREAGDILTWQPEKIPAPGILYYRTLPYGKNKVLIVQY